MFCKSTLLAGLLIATCGLTLGADTGCSGWDDLVEDMLFSPIKDDIVNASAEFLKLPPVFTSFGHGVSVTAMNGTVGNLTSFDIIHLPNVQGDATYMCQVDGNITLMITVGIKDLEINFDNFLVTIPILPNIGATKTSFKNTGNAVSISVSLLSNETSDCIPTLNYLQIQDFGKTSVNFAHGVSNTIYEFIISHGLNFAISILKRFGFWDSIDRSIENGVSTMISEQGKKICDIMNL